MDHAQKAKDIIESIWYITLASATRDGKPWNTPLYTSYDDAYRFFWASWTGTQHSMNIRENPSVFITIFDSRVPEGAGEGVFIEAEATELNDPAEIEHAMRHHYGRKSAPMRPLEAFTGDSPRRMYQATPKRVWINLDSEMKGDHIDTRKEISLL